jgi:hypothetical protein
MIRTAVIGLGFTITSDAEHVAAHRIFIEVLKKQNVTTSNKLLKHPK